MKKWLILAVLGLIFSIGFTPVSANSIEPKQFTSTPIYDGNKIMLPVRAVATQAGFQVLWNASTRSIDLVKGAARISMKNNSFVNIKGTAYAPIGILESTLNVDIKWDAIHNKVTLSAGLVSNTVNIGHMSMHVPDGWYWMQETESRVTLTNFDTKTAPETDGLMDGLVKVDIYVSQNENGTTINDLLAEQPVVEDGDLLESRGKININGKEFVRDVILSTYGGRTKVYAYTTIYDTEIYRIHAYVPEGKMETFSAKQVENLINSVTFTN